MTAWEVARAVLLAHGYQPGSAAWYAFLRYAESVGTAALERQARAGRELWPCCWAPRAGAHAVGCRKA